MTTRNEPALYRAGGGAQFSVTRGCSASRHEGAPRILLFAPIIPLSGIIFKRIPTGSVFIIIATVSKVNPI